MNSFPLYNQIVNNVPTSDLTPTEKEFFSENIKKICTIYEPKKI